MVKLQQVKGQFSLTIPKEYIEQMKWQKGDTIVLGFNERGNLELKKVGK